MQAELDAMERVLVATREKLRALEESIDAQTVRLQAMRALSARPGVSCDESTDAAERLASALTLSARAARAGARAGDSHHRSSDPMDDPTDPDDSTSAGADDFGGLVMSSAAHLYANGGRAVAKRRDRWHDHLRLIAAVKIDAPITALAVMPQRGEHELSRYFAVGDDAGSVHVFRPDGDLALVLTPPAAVVGVPVTYIHCALVRRNETLIVAGHADGAIAARVVAESGFDQSGRLGDDASNVVGDHPQTLSLAGDGFSFAMRDATPAAASARPARARSARGGPNGRGGGNAAERERMGWRAQDADEVEGADGGSDGGADGGAGDGDVARCDGDGDGARCSVHASTGGGDESTGWRRIQNPRRVVAAEMFRIRDVRYVAVADASGKVAVFRVPTGGYNGSGARGTHPNQWRLHLHSVHRSVDGVVSFRQSPHYVAWVGARGAGAADVAATLEVLHKPCHNLNGTHVQRLKFDVAASGRFVGVGGGGELLTGFVNVDANRAMCVVRSVTRPRGLSSLTPDVSLAAIKGYAFAANPYEVSVLNTTVVGKKPPREVTTAPLPHLSAMFGRQLATNELSNGPGLVASNRGRLVVVAFPDGLLASYESDLPTWRPPPMNTKLWSQPAFVAAMGLIGLWQFYRSRGHAAMGSSWGGPSVGKGGDGGGLDPKLLEQLMGGKDGVGGVSKGIGVGGGGGGGGGGRKVASGDFGEGAMRRPGYANFDPAAFRAEMKKSGKWS